jgi:NAD(P)H dehydrogenase (quinone)
MNIFIVYWHPEPRSFNGALLRTAVEALAGSGHSVKTSDLHAMRFDPVSGRHNFNTVKDHDYFKQQIEELHATETGGFSIEIEAEMEKLEWCDLLILQFPLWWFGLPAALKGWVDRVFAMGRVYGMGRIYETGVFKGKRAMLSLTTGGPEEAYRKGGFNGDIDAILRPIQRGILQFVGFSVLKPHIAFGPAHLSEDQRREKLDRYANRLRTLADESPIEVGFY